MNVMVGMGYDSGSECMYGMIGMGMCNMMVGLSVCL